MMIAPFNPELDLEINRLLKAPVVQVWRCWTEPALLEQWFAPKPVITRDAVIEAHPGGRFFSRMILPDGTEHAGEGCVLQALPQRLFVFTDTLEAGWRPATGAALGFTGSISMTEEDGGTRYIARAIHGKADTQAAHAAMGFHDGWGTATTQLEALAGGLETGLADRQITLTRLIRAAPARVWAAWTDPALLPQWFGPEGYSCTTKEIDLRQGGLWRFDMTGPDGKVWPNRHRFTRHVPEQRLEFTLDGDDDASSQIEVVVTMTPEAGGTRLTQVMTLPDVATREAVVSFGAVELGQTTLAKLAALVEA